MAQTSIASDLHQALDGLGPLAAEVALDDQIAVDDVTELRDLVLGEVLDLRVRVDAQLREDLVRGRLADSVDVRETDLNALVEGDVHPRDASQSSSLPLSLLVSRVLADDENPPVAADDLALLAHRLDRRSYLHGPFRLMIQTWALAAGTATATLRRNGKFRRAQRPRGPERDPAG